MPQVCIIKGCQHLSPKTCCELFSQSTFVSASCDFYIIWGKLYDTTAASSLYSSVTNFHVDFIFCPSNQVSSLRANITAMIIWIIANSLALTIHANRCHSWNSLRSFHSYKRYCSQHMGPTTQSGFADSPIEHNSLFEFPARLTYLQQRLLSGSLYNLLCQCCCTYTQGNGACVARNHLS